MLSVQGRRPLPTVPKSVAWGVKGSTGAPWEVRRMTYVTTNAKLEEIRATLAAQEQVEPLTVRQFIGWFNAERRGYKAAWRIRRALDRVNLKTVPDFDGAHIDARIRFVLDEPPAEAAATATQQTEPVPETTHPRFKSLRRRHRHASHAYSRRSCRTLNDRSFDLGLTASGRSRA